MEYQRNPAPFLGAAYYPEDWDDGEQPGDIAKMQEAGLKAVRIGEFAWRKMEPKEGSFHFTWLHEVVDRLKEAGISVILGTPTATPPIWFLRKHPDAAGHEFRRNPNQPRRTASLLFKQRSIPGSVRVHHTRHGAGVRPRRECDRMAAG